MGEGSARIEAGTSSESRLRHRSPRDQRGSSHEPAPGVDAQLADTLASLDRQFERPRRDDTLDERPVDAHDSRDLPCSNDRNQALPIPDARLQIYTPGR